VRPTLLCAQQHFSAPLSAARELHAGDTAIGDVSHGVVSVVSVVVVVMLRHGEEVTGSPRGRGGGGQVALDVTGRTLATKKKTWE
jgi:hypothetical protein